MTIAFLMTSLVIVAMPVPGAIHTIAAGLQRGRCASLVAALGCTLGIVPHAYGIFAAALRRRVLGRASLATLIRRVFAGSYLALAGRLALPEH